MKEYIGYDVKARKKVKILEPEAVQMKNKRWAIKGKSAETGLTIYRIIGKEEAEQFQK